MSDFENERSQHSAATLICDYSANDLNQLLFQSNEANDDMTQLNSLHTSPGKQSSADKYNQLTKLDDEEENVDFVQLFNQYQQVTNQEMQHLNQYGSHQPPNEAQVQYYQPSQMLNESYSERLNQSYTNQPQLVQQNQQPNGIPLQGGKNQRAMRPGSATVAGQGGRFLNNQQVKRKYGQNGSVNQLDQYSYSYQQPAPLMNNLMGGNQGGGMRQVSGGLTTQGSHQPLQFQQQLQKPPLGLGRKRTRPQSAAKNQLQPSKELQSVTNFTYQKAKQNLNQKAYLPDSLKNTDKESLYEEKIHIKKQLNEQIKHNQQLKTQLQSQLGLIRKKDEMVKQMMKQMFNTGKDSGQNMDNFLQEFQKREILHNQGAGQVTALKTKSSSKGVKSQNVMVNKESQITSIKLKMKELNEQLMSKDKELQDLKQTLKFTKIKEYESELALNVQESQRLRALLEREIRKPKIDPRFVQGLKQQIGQYQQIIQHLQQNQSIQQENQDKLNKKLILQIKKFAKQKEARKRALEKNQRLEKKVSILQSKVENGAGPSQKASKQAQNANLQNMQLQWKQRFDEQSNLIEKLLMKMQDCGIEINEDELIEMQMGGNAAPDQEEEAEMQQNPAEQFGGEEIEDEDKNTWDVIVAYGGAIGSDGQKNQTVTKQISGANFENLDHLKEYMRKQFEIEEEDQIKIKYVTEEGELNELADETWEHLKQLSLSNQIQLGIELVKPESEVEASNYEDDDDFEEIEKTYSDPIQSKQVKDRFKELRIILQIKNIKRGDALKFILHGLQNPETNKKAKVISIESLKKQIKSKIGFDEETSLTLSKFLIEKANEEGKIEILEGKDFKEQTHEQACTIVRKDLHTKLQSLIEDYVLYNGFAITSLLSRVQGLFDDQREEFADELEGRDYDDLGTASMENIYESMGLVGLHPDQFDSEISDFMNFLAIRHSKSLEEVVYKDFVKALDPDYSYIEDKKSIWLLTGKGEENQLPYEPSSDEGELESERSPPKSEHIEEEEKPEMNQENLENPPQQEGEAMETSDNIDDLEQNVLLEKVDEILMQIVQRLPQHHKIRTLTQYMVPFLSQVVDQEQQRQYLIINQDAFVQFLLGQGQNQLGLQLEENHIICLLHLLVREDEKDQQDTQNKYILYDEFVELVKTYMKKELIMNQSKGLGINYDILSKQSVEFLFQIRSSLMHDSQNNINENSADEEELAGGSSQKKTKSVPSHIREIFNRIIQQKNIQLKNNNAKNGSKVEVMDFDLMLDILFMRMGIHSPSNKSQEELKYLMCLDFKYLEMVMLVKFDKIMHDLDYISIDLLRQAQDPNMDGKRKQTLEQLKKIRDEQLSILKAMQDKRSALKHQQQALAQPSQGQIYAQGRTDGYEFNGVSQSSKQEKKRKRPDDKKQTLSKKLGSNNNVQYASNKESQQNLDQDQYGASSSHNISPGANARYGAKQDHFAGNVQSNHDVEPRHVEAQDHQEGMFPGEDFDNIDVDLDVDINHKDKKKGISEDFEEDYLQDDIPIDDDDDDDDDGMISDNYDNFDKTMTKSNKVASPMGGAVDNGRNRAPEVEDHVISMDHSDDIEESGKPEFVLPSDGRSPDDRHQMQDEVDEDDLDEDEDMDDDDIEDQYDDDVVEDDMDIEGMDPEELEQAILSAGLMQQDMAGDESQPISSDRLEQSMPQPESRKLDQSMPPQSDEVAESMPQSSPSRHSASQVPSQQMISGRSHATESQMDRYSDIVDEKSQRSSAQKSKRSVHQSSNLGSAQGSRHMPKGQSSRKSHQSSMKSSIQSFQKAGLSSRREQIDDIVEDDLKEEQYQDEFEHQSSQQSATLQQAKEVNRYSKTSSHSSRKQSLKSNTASQRASQRVSEKASQRYRYTNESSRGDQIGQDIQQQKASSSLKSLDKQERSPDQQKADSEIEDFDIEVPSAKGSQYAAHQQQDQASEQYEADQYEEAISSASKGLSHSKNQPFADAGSFKGGLNSSSQQKIGSLAGIDDQKSSVQLVKEDQYIQDDFESDDYEDDLHTGALGDSRSSHHSANLGRVQVDQAKEPSNLHTDFKPMTKTTSKNQLAAEVKAPDSDAELAEDDYEF